MEWEKEMATHSSILAWRIPRTEEPGGLQSMGSQRVRHDEVTNATRWYGTEGKSINLLLEDLNFFKKLYPHFPVAMV